jgi:hypothetical protein
VASEGEASGRAGSGAAGGSEARNKVGSGMAGGGEASGRTGGGEASGWADSGAAGGARPALERAAVKHVAAGLAATRPHARLQRDDRSGEPITVGESSTIDEKGEG